MVSEKTTLFVLKSIEQIFNVHKNFNATHSTDEGTVTINGNPCDPVAEGWTNTMIECIVSNSLYRSGNVEVQVTIMSLTGTGEQVCIKKYTINI